MPNLCIFSYRGADEEGHGESDWRDKERPRDGPPPPIERSPWF